MRPVQKDKTSVECVSKLLEQFAGGKKEKSVTTGNASHANHVQLSFFRAVKIVLAIA